MASKLYISSSPHIQSAVSTAGIMRDVLIALLPATVAGCVIFGLRALAVIAVCLVFSVGAEFLFNVIMKKEQTVGDLSAAVTGLLLALNLPANAPLWQAAVGSVFAIIIVKCIFGGIGCNVVNPAITARVFMLIAFSEMAKSAFPIADTVSSATPLALIAENELPSLSSLLLGTTGGIIGETCAVALLFGAAYLLIRRVISLHIPAAFIGTVFVLSLIIADFNIMTAVSLVLSGGLIIGAFFMATDYVTSPMTALGKIIFGVGAGLITVLIRFYGNYPEGVSFAILLMNIVSPYIDKLTQRKLFGGSTE